MFADGRVQLQVIGGQLRRLPRRIETIGSQLERNVRAEHKDGRGPAHHHPGRNPLEVQQRCRLTGKDLKLALLASGDRKHFDERISMTTETHPSNDPATVPRLHLRHGHSIPHLGLGTWPLVGEECETAVRYAIRSGYRLVDTAFQYRNEDAVGRGVRTAGVAREELFVSSKFNKESHSVDGVQRAYDRSLQALGLDYLDMFMCHWPVPALDQYTEAWRGLVKLLDEGRVKAIGVSNFKPDHLEKVIAATGVVPDVNQIQLSPDLARLPPRAVHQDLGIITEAWSPIGRESGLRDHPIVVQIAQRTAKSPAQVLLRWHVQQGIVPIPQAAK
ncbi:aldo/keto reductase, partial [Dietzia cercidiphylli]|uniref:aldo/keto reductase n=2 Tax=Dietzia cercidiphylli TaxID=498199 RepID=UPI0031E1D949